MLCLDLLEELAFYDSYLFVYTSLLSIALVKSGLGNFILLDLQLLRSPIPLRGRLKLFVN